MFQYLIHRGARRRRGKAVIFENESEKIMKENFPNLEKEIDMQVQEAQRVPKKWDQGGTHQDTSSLNYPRLKIRKES